MLSTISLKKNFEFLRVYKKGVYYVGRYMTIYTLPNNTNINKLGITVSKKVGKSVRRNRIKRIIKESYFQIENDINIGIDIIFVSRNYNEEPNFWKIYKEMKYLVKKAKINKREDNVCSE